MPHAYATYFDVNYLVKGVAMIRSLLASDPGSSVRVVCLDDDTFRLLARLDIPGLIPVRLAVLEAGDEALAAARANRSRVEYYWTLTPTVLLRFLKDMEKGESLTYVDADMLFFSSAEAVFDEMEGKSVLIHGHNFPPRYASFAVNGLYNVGLVSFRNDGEGLRVLNWWRERCNEWCYDRCEDGKMGDQKYLESFPSLTTRLAVAQNPGIGVAPWNYTGYSLDGQGEAPRVNGTPTVFFHYHSAAYIAPGCLAPCTDLHYPCTRDMLRLFAVPYLEALDAALAEVRKIRPDFRAGFKTSGLTTDMCVIVRNDMAESFREDYPCILPLTEHFKVCASSQFPEGLKQCGPVIRAGALSWVGDYPDWESAEQAAGGYDDRAIFEKTRDAARAVRDGKALWERDSVLFREEEWNWPLLASLLGVAARDGGRLHVLDFGGAFGSTCMQHRTALAGLTECTWHIVEQEHFVAAGKAEFSTDTLHFHSTPEEAFNAAPINVILLSGVLQYLPDPYSLLKRLRGTKLPIIVDRTPMLPDHDRITVQHVPASIYKASYACRWLNRRRIAGLLESAGYVLSPWYDSAVDPKGFVGVTAIPQTARAADSPKLTEIPRPLRVMQVDDFYPGYLDAFYRARPGLTLKSSREQLDALLKDGFSAVHAVVPCLPKNECETEYFVHQALPLQRAWAREQNLTFPAENPDWQGEMIRRRVESFRPDVLYMADPVRFDGRFLATLPFRPRLVLGWKGADVPFNADFHGYDAILSGLPKLLRFAETRGAGRGVMFRPGMPRWLADAVADTPKTVDVCFVGSVSPSQHTRRISMLDALARAASEHGFSLALHLNCDPRMATPAMRPWLRPPVFGLAMMQALAASRIVADDRAKHGVIMPDGSKKIDLGGEDTINMRMFEATGSGALLLTEALPGVRRYFEPGKEVAVWKDVPELVARTLHYLAHESECSAVAEAGRRRCLAEHSMDDTVKRFIKIVHDNLPG